MITSIALAPNHTFVAACGDGTMRLYDRRLDRRNAVTTQIGGHSCWVQSVRWQAYGENQLMSAYKGEGTNYAHWTSLLAFDYSYDTFTQPDTNTNADFAKVNAFYIVNTVHDITYRYGFTEEAFNFQNYNFRTSVSL